MNKKEKSEIERYEEANKLMIKLGEKLIYTLDDFISNNFNDSHKIVDMIYIILLSSVDTSCYMIKTLSEQNKEIYDETNKLIEEIEKFFTDKIKIYYKDKK